MIHFFIENGSVVIATSHIFALMAPVDRVLIKLA